MFLRRERYRSDTVIPQDRILNKTTAATTSLSQISYAVNYQRCFSASGATISPAHAQAHRVSLAGRVSQHGVATQALLSGDPGLDTKPAEVCLGYSVTPFISHPAHEFRLWSPFGKAETFLFFGASRPALGTI